MRINEVDLHITDACNLKCKYCYLYQGNYRRLPDLPDYLIECLPEVIKRLGAKKINFFGGEPMTRPDLIKKVHDHVKSQLPDIRFHIVSNGTLGDAEFASWMKANKVGIQRSIDGCPEACALNRPDISEQFFIFFSLFGDRGPRRSTITEDAVPYIYRSWLWLQRHGFRGWTPIPDCYREWSDESIELFLNQFKAIARDIVREAEKGVKPPHVFWFARLAPVLDGAKAGAFGCGAGRTLIALRQDGFFFACHRFVSDDPTSDWCLGHVEELLSGRDLSLGPTAQLAIKTMKEEFATAPELEQCRKCEVRAGCGGGCYHVNRAIYGNAAKPAQTWCKIRKGMLPIAKWINERIGHKYPGWYRPASQQKAQGNMQTQMVQKPCQQSQSSDKAPAPTASGQCAKLGTIGTSRS